MLLLEAEPLNFFFYSEKRWYLQDRLVTTPFDTSNTFVQLALKIFFIHFVIFLHLGHVFLYHMKLFQEDIVIFMQLLNSTRVLEDFLKKYITIYIFEGLIKVEYGTCI